MSGMSLETIRQKIIQDAEAEGERILSQARHEKKAALEEARARLTARAEKDKVRLLESLKQRKARLREQALRAEERSLLNTRRRLIDEALHKAVASLASSPDYASIIESLLAGCDFTGEVEVIISAADAGRINQQFLDRHSSDMVRFRLSDQRHNARGGLILRSGRVSRNATLDMMASLVHEEMVMELSRMLPLKRMENL